jgi:hypothetical protein
MDLALPRRDRRSRRRSSTTRVKISYAWCTCTCIHILCCCTYTHTWIYRCACRCKYIGTCVEIGPTVETLFLLFCCNESAPHTVSYAAVLISIHTCLTTNCTTMFILRATHAMTRQHGSALCRFAPYGLSQVLVVDA